MPSHDCNIIAVAAAAAQSATAVVLLLLCKMHLRCKEDSHCLSNHAECYLCHSDSNQYTTQTLGQAMMTDAAAARPHLEVGPNASGPLPTAHAVLVCTSHYWCAVAAAALMWVSHHCELQPARNMLGTGSECYGIQEPGSSLAHTYHV